MTNMPSLPPPLGVQHEDFPDGHPSSYQAYPTGLNFGEQMGAIFFVCLFLKTLSSSCIY